MCLTLIQTNHLSCRHTTFVLIHCNIPSCASPHTRAFPDAPIIDLPSDCPACMQVRATRTAWVLCAMACAAFALVAAFGVFRALHAWLEARVGPYPWEMVLVGGSMAGVCVLGTVGT
jgi:hypothetical protein